MSHFAKVENGIVTDVIVSEKDFINSGAVGDEFLWIQTSYNNNFRANFASIGDTYNILKNVFIKPQPFNSWILNEDTYQWEAPTIMPDPIESTPLHWNEDTLSWDEVVDPT